MQFLINKEGRVYINDVRDVSFGPSEKAIGKIKELRGVAVGNLYELQSETDDENSPCTQSLVRVNPSLFFDSRNREGTGSEKPMYANRQCG
ncbi:hypothetical protein [Piscirickettsia litoralis]|uniref:Uncharacterized protein n=1 Tax=Piscirickettsia litoralis TaxID=1891921 RepID=A0ABX3A1Z0_9GAMM|nr:hypothetical protein [Piscirickettsia litoralis]ODN42871.1 hypothetical protein BGC07_07965 [Piscirickettsia litoralis]